MMMKIDYFKDIAGIESLEAPAMFLHKGLNYEDAIIGISKQVSDLRKKQAKAESEAATATKRRGRKLEHLKKTDERLRRRADAMIENPDEIEAKKNRSKQLDNLCKRGGTSQQVLG